MNNMNKKNIYIIGIGGIGASALGRLFHEQGHNVSGSDMEHWSLIDDLKEEGIKVTIGHDEKNLPENADLVIYSEAIPENNIELVKAKKNKMKTQTYFEALGDFSKNYVTIAVAGAHGKTTVTAMAAKVLIEAGIDPTVVIGSKMKELGNRNSRLGNSQYMIVEACEYRRSFLHLHPNIAIITNIEFEHPDYYKDEEDYKRAFDEFISLIPENGKKITGSPKVDFELQIPGDYNKENAGLVMELADYLGIPQENAKQSLQNYTGAWRRFEIKDPIGETIIIDDYGHHPTEIKATLKGVREKYPNSKVLCVFQPHQYTRTYELLSDFAKSFKDADEVIIPNIYKVRDSEEDVAKVSPQKLVDAINEETNNARFGNGLDATKKEIHEKAADYDVIIVMGAGDIWKILE